MRSFIKFSRIVYSRTTTYHVPSKKKGEKKKRERERTPLSKSAKNSPGQTAAALVSSLSIFALQPRGSELIAFVFPRYEAGLMRGNTLQGGKTWKLAAFSSHPRELFLARCIANRFKRNRCGFLARRGNMKPGFGPPRTRPSR